MLDVLGLVAVVVLIAANGYFVAAEFAYVAARRQKFVEAADHGDKKSAKAVRVHRRLSFMLSGAQLGITVTSLVLGFIARPAIAGLIEPALTAAGLPESSAFGVSLTIAFILATIAQMVFGELAPKNLAIAKPEPVSRAVAGSMLAFMRIAGPVIRLFDGSANRLLRLVGIEPVEELHGAVSVDELDLIVDESAERGHLTESQAALLERALDFGQLRASDAMVPWNRVETLPSTATAADLHAAIAVRSRLPVVDDGTIVGVVHAKDLLGIDRDCYTSTGVEEMMHQVVAVPEAARLSSVLGLLQRQSTELAVVIDEYGGPAGVITLEDVVEELVGEIEDEHDGADDDQPVERKPGVWSVPGSYRPDELERATGLLVPDGEYETVAGLILERLGRVAKVGDAVVVDGVRLTVSDVDGYAVAHVEAAVNDGDGAGDDDATGSNDHDDTAGDDTAGHDTASHDIAGDDTAGERADHDGGQS